MVRTWREDLTRLALLLLASYGLLYFSYKYYVPFYGGMDFITAYQHTYLHPFDFSVAHVPFIFRQLSAALVHLVYASGLFYSSDIQFHFPGIDQRLFFAALCTNYIALGATAWLVGEIVKTEIGQDRFLPALTGGLVCLLSFQTQVSVITGATEGVSWMLAAFGFLFYIRKALLPLAIVLAVAVLQREVILICFAALSAIALVLDAEGRRFHLKACGIATGCFAIYLAMRGMMLDRDNTPHLHPVTMFWHLISYRPTSEFIFQGVLSQNVLFMYFVLTGVVARGSERHWFWIICGAFAAIALAQLAGGSENNLGRISGILTPLLAARIAILSSRMKDGARPA